MIKRITLRCVLIGIVVLVAICGYKYYQYGNIFVDKTSLEDGWETALINDDNYVDKEYEPSLVKLANGERVDERIYPQLQAMFDDARRQGLSITVRSGYRSWEEQKELWEEEISRLAEEGVSLHDAKRSGVLSVQRPGMSEHQAGLAVDINSMPNVSGDALYNWLQNNAHRYGFVLRYPNDKSEITGITYEPWHFRYVGEETASIMKNENLCLEEYVERYE